MHDSPETLAEPERAPVDAVDARPGTIRRARLMRDLVLVALATTVTNLAAYLLSMAAAWVLAPAEFGAFGALLGLSIIGSTAAMAAQALTARVVAVAPPAERAAVAEGAMRATHTTAWALALLGLVAAWPAAELMHTQPIAVFAAVGSVAVLVVGFAALGVAQGLGDNVRFGRDYALLGLLRAAVAVVAIVIHPSAMSACIGMLAGSILGTLVVLHRRPERAHVPVAVPGAGRELWRNIVSIVALFALINLDVVLARMFLDRDTSADYAVGSLVAKIAFFFPLFVSLTLFARMATSRERRHHALALGATMGLAACTVLVTYALAEPIVRIVAGPGYVTVAPWLWIFAAQGGVFAVVQSTLYSRLSDGDRSAAGLIWVACVGFVVVVAAWAHRSLEDILSASLTVGVLLMMAGIVTELRRQPAIQEAT